MSTWNSNPIQQYRSRINRANASIKALRRLDLQVRVFRQQQEAAQQNILNQIERIENAKRFLISLSPFVNTPKPGDVDFGAFDRVLEERVWIGAAYSGI